VPEPLAKVVRASCDPRTLTITLPEKLYIRIADNDLDAAHTLFHELGHLFLLHAPTLHLEPETPPDENEDSEWQADRFADRVMLKMTGNPWSEGGGKQLRLFR